MDLTWISGWHVLCAVAVAIIWAKAGKSRKTKQENRTRSRREEFQIDPESVPEYQPTWNTLDRR